MKQTAVEWLVSQQRHNTFFSHEIIEQAKEMEKQQIIEAFEIGYDNGACVNEGENIYYGSKYYKETFNK
jgi:hypothetical protein